MDNVERELQGILTKVAGMKRCPGRIEFLKQLVRRNFN